MIFDQTVKLGDLLTAGSVAIAVATLVTGLYRNERLKQKEYADRIRQAAAATAIAIGRWVELAGSLYTRLQPLITDTDASC
jgi:ABC-type nickel/cobalt efflux system permease component RcnA